MRGMIRGAVLVGIGVLVSAASVRASEWHTIGQRVLDYRTNPAVISARSDAGPVSKIKLQVRQQELEIRSLTLTFAGGESATVEVNRYIPAGGSTAAIDIPGGSKSVDKVEVSYAPGTTKDKLPVVEVLGTS